MSKVTPFPSGTCNHQITDKRKFKRGREYFLITYQFVDPPYNGWKGEHPIHKRWVPIEYLEEE